MNLFKSLFSRFSEPEVDWEQVETDLIRADLGPKTVLELLDALQDQLAPGAKAREASEIVARDLRALFPAQDPPELEPRASAKPRAVLIVGVNGVGKTTSVAKLAHRLQGQGHAVVCAAADTFRAGAIEQLQSWGQRLNFEVVAGRYQQDPSGVCFDAYRRAEERGAAFVLFDTAGRLHNRAGLMEQLAKVKRTMARFDAEAPHDTLLVVDATTGSNALVQAREFHAVTPLTGLIATKLDGSGKAGVLVAIQRELGLIPRYLGTGEEPGDLQPFSSDAYVQTLL